MKTNKYSTFQKFLLIALPVIVLLLIASIVMCFAFSFLPMSVHDIVKTGNITIVLSVVSSALAVIGIVFAVIGKGGSDSAE